MVIHLSGIFIKTLEIVIRKQRTLSIIHFRMENTFSGLGYLTFKIHCLVGPQKFMYLNCAALDAIKFLLGDTIQFWDSVIAFCVLVTHPDVVLPGLECQQHGSMNKLKCSGFERSNDELPPFEVMDKTQFKSQIDSS